MLFFLWSLHRLGLLPIGLAIPSRLCLNIFERPGQSYWMLYEYCCHSFIHEVIKLSASSPGLITLPSQKGMICRTCLSILNFKEYLNDIIAMPTRFPLKNRLFNKFSEIINLKKHQNCIMIQRLRILF